MLKPVTLIKYSGAYFVAILVSHMIVVTNKSSYSKTSELARLIGRVSLFPIRVLRDSFNVTITGWMITVNFIFMAFFLALMTLLIAKLLKEYRSNPKRG